MLGQKKRYKTNQGFRRTKLWISTRASCTCTTMTHTRAHGTHETDPSAIFSGRPSPTHRTRPTRLRCAAGGALCIEIRPEWAEQRPEWAEQMGRNGLRRDPKRARKERRSKTRLRCAAGNSDERQPVLRHEGLSRKPPEDETSLELAMLCMRTIAVS